MWTERHVREIQEAAAGSDLRGLPAAWPAQLKQRPDADDAIAFLLKYFFGHLRMEKAQAAAAEQFHAPPPRERERSRGDRPRREDRPERGERKGRGEQREESTIR